MAEGQRFEPGRAIVIRELWQGKIWSARPAIVVQDTPELIGCYILPGSLWKMPRSAKGERVRPADRPCEGWRLYDATWLDISLLRLSIPGQRYSVLIFRDEQGLLTRWYINLEEPLERTPLGFDFYDRILDVILTPDLSSWHWEDEDELEEAVAAGLISPEKAYTLYTDGQTVVELLQSGRSVFNHWAKWQPDPSWTVPVLPEGWDKL
jgi:predicted RNA-binding protein associated with RNAse of E/G family